MVSLCLFHKNISLLLLKGSQIDSGILKVNKMVSRLPLVFEKIVQSCERKPNICACEKNCKLNFSYVKI